MDGLDRIDHAEAVAQARVEVDAVGRWVATTGGEAGSRRSPPRGGDRGRRRRHGRIAGGTDEIRGAVAEPEVEVERPSRRLESTGAASESCPPGRLAGLPRARPAARQGRRRLHRRHRGDGGRRPAERRRRAASMGRAAENSARAVGMGTEEYSRWVAVADDAGIAAAKMDAGLLALNKGMLGGSKAFAQYGIAIKDASGATRSTNDVMLDVVQTLSEIEDPTARSAAGLALLGKGYASLAPLIGGTEEEMRGYLASVSEAQVVTEEEAAKAKEMALAQDALSDALSDVRVAVGEMLVALAPLIELVAKGVQVFADLLSPLGDLGGAFSETGEAATAVIPAFQGLHDKLAETGGLIPGLVSGIKGLFGAEEEVAEGADTATQAFTEQALAMNASKSSNAEIEAALKASGASADQVTVAMDAVGDARGKAAAEETAGRRGRRREEAGRRGSSEGGRGEGGRGGPPPPLPPPDPWPVGSRRRRRRRVAGVRRCEPGRSPTRCGRRSTPRSP